MFKALLEVQWKSTRVLMLLAALIGFALPVLSSRATRPSSPGTSDGRLMVMAMESFGVGYVLLAAGCGLAVAILAWSADHRGRHVYALTLPVSRARYAAMRYGAGILFILIPTLAVLLGCLVAVATTRVATGLHAYPIALTLRFFLATALSFSIFFAISAATAKTAGVVLAVIGAGFVLSVVLSASSRLNAFEYFAAFLFAEPGVLSVFTGRWTLFDA
jgi:hypothetical protein